MMTEQTPARQTIAIIEDDEGAALFLKSMLESEGFRVRVFHDGESALETLATGIHVDLVLLDILLKGIDGYEVCRIMKRDAQLRYIPIIILSGKSSTEEKVLGLKLGADDYIVKPFKNKELLAKIQVLLRIKQLQDQLINVEKLAAIGQLSAGVAHEFNNLIGGMLGYAQLGQMNLDDGELIKKALSVIEKSCYRAKELTENMLLFSSNQVKTGASCELGSCVDHALVLLTNQLDKSNISFSTVYNHRSHMLIDANRLLQILINLFQNSIQSLQDLPSDRKRKIYLRSFEADSFVGFDFQDTGSGIPPEIRERVFEPFFTTHGALGGGTGGATGMGLSVVYGIISSHHGMIRLLESSARGTTFRIMLPVFNIQSHDTSKVFQDAPPLNPATRFTGKVLIVDDQQIYRNLLADLLVRLGLEVSSAASGEEALELCRSQHFDLIFMDYLMPGIGGIDAAARIEEEGNQGGVVFITGKNVLPGLRDSLGEQHNRYFLSKPVDLQQLFQIVEQELPRSK